MVIVAHPDDESGGAGIVLQRLEKAVVVFCTDGAPTDPWFWKKYDTRERYAVTRRNEALDALSLIGITDVNFLAPSSESPFRDQLLYTALPSAIEMVVKIMRQCHPANILTTAYEGGHPDHDCCSFIASVVGRLSNIPVWEFPVYYRNPNGELRYQEFHDADASEIQIVPREGEAAIKHAMLKKYCSQPDLEVFASAPVDFMRRQKLYDYGRPPATVINYEHWGWQARASELCAHFKDCIAQLASSNSDQCSGDVELVAQHQQECLK